MKLLSMKFIRLLMTFLILFDMCISTNIKRKEIQIAITNKWGKFAEGLFISLAGEDKSWMTCLPDSWVNEKENPVEVTSLISELFSKVVSTGKKITLIVDNFALLYCKARQYSQILWSFVFKDLTKKVFLEGKFEMKSINSRESLYSWLKSKVTGSAQWTEEKLNEAWNSLSEAAQSFTSTYKLNMIDFKRSLVGLYDKNIWSRMQEIINCLKSGKGAIKTYWNIVRALIEKSQLINNENLTVEVISSLIVNLLCEKEEFKDLIKVLGFAFDQKEEGQKFYYFGKFVGKLMKFLAK